MTASGSRPWPPIAVTTNRWLRQELEQCERHSGFDFDHTTSIPYARRHARHSPMVIIGADVAARVRRPLHSAGLVIIAALDMKDRRAYIHGERLNVAYVVVLPDGRPWLADKLLHPTG